MLYGDSFVYMSVLLDRGYGKIYNGKVNALLHFYTTRAAQTFDCAAQVGAELRYNIKIIYRTFILYSLSEKNAR